MSEESMNKNMNDNEKFLLVSLNDKKAKKLAQVISNDSCRKILDYLAEKEGSESELSKELNIPISTVHYNLQHLMKANLVIVDEFHYSEKGKEINHYKLANKYIIIAPKNTSSIAEKLRKILPIGIIGIVIVGALGFMNAMLTSSGSMSSSFESAPRQISNDLAAKVMMDSATEASPVVSEAINHGINFWSQPATWFGIGVLSTIAVYFLVKLIIKLIKKRKTKLIKL